MKKYLVFEGELVDIMAEEDVRADWKEKLGLAVRYQATHRMPTVTIFEVLDERKAIKYYNHDKVKIMNKEKVKKYMDELNRDYPEYVLKDSAALLADLFLSGKINLTSDKTQIIAGYKADKPLNCQENLKVLYDAGMGGILKRPKPTID